VPGSISLIMMMIGSLLTALVVAREWERGTMEALLATPVGILEFMIGKLVPNFLLGLGAMGMCVLASVFVFQIPLRGSLLVLIGFTAAFLAVALSIGLLISTVARTQFLASQLAMLVAFLPGLYLSGFLFEIASMPAVLRWISVIVPAKYYVRGLSTIFLAGDIASVLVPATAVLLAMSAVLFALTALNTRQRLD
jgi:ABC-2 type transport system permease protein